MDKAVFKWYIAVFILYLKVAFVVVLTKNNTHVFALMVMAFEIAALMIVRSCRLMQPTHTVECTYKMTSLG